MYLLYYQKPRNYVSNVYKRCARKHTTVSKTNCLADLLFSLIKGLTISSKQKLHMICDGLDQIKTFCQKSASQQKASGIMNQS